MLPPLGSPVKYRVSSHSRGALDSRPDATPPTIQYTSPNLAILVTGLGINITSPGSFALNVNGGTFLSYNLKISGTTKLKNNTTLFFSLNVSDFKISNYNTTILSSLNIGGNSNFNDINLFVDEVSTIIKLNRYYKFKYNILFIKC
jgi:hypothetical protein